MWHTRWHSTPCTKQGGLKPSPLWSKKPEPIRVKQLCEQECNKKTSALLEKCLTISPETRCQQTSYASICCNENPQNILNKPKSCMTLFVNNNVAKRAGVTTRCSSRSPSLNRLSSRQLPGQPQFATNGNVLQIIITFCSMRIRGRDSKAPILQSRTIANIQEPSKT